jgi:hypothetical protein
MAMRVEADGHDLETRVTFEKVGAPGVPVEGHIGDIGIASEERLGGGNTAHHIPQGILITYGKDIAPDPSRKDVDVREMAPAILGMLGVAAERSPAVV